MVCLPIRIMVFITIKYKPSDSPKAGIQNKIF